tara:strand:- start:1 stop:465 length:465 start_codon:yes stop_codon:yes gene_type:complete
MVCITSCVIAIILTVTNIYVATSPANSRANHNFYGTLTPDLIVRYKNIVAERGEIYIRGMAAGIVIAVGTFFLLKDHKALSKKCRLCIIVAITLVVNCVFYLIYPKSDYMIPHLTTEKQRVAWLRCHKSYQISYLTGLILGCATSYLLASGLCI